VSIIHRTTLTPTKLELLAGWLPSRPWYTGPGRDPVLAKAGGFRLDDPEGEVGIEFMVARDGRCAYHVPLTYRAAPLDGARDALIGTTSHGVLGRRWVYDGTRDPVLVTQLAALFQGAAVPQAQSISDTPDPSVLSRPVTGPRSAGGPLAASGALEAADGPDGTRVRLGAGAAGTLVIAVTRVLQATAGDQPGPGGQVTATWRRSEDGDAAVRGVFATATLA
jgi:Maltokinase N-terminal cap domain